jgi:cytochrome c oxidase cbb3-type subunit 3
VRNAAAYVRSLSGLPHDSLKAQLGKPIFAANCAACHGPDGKGNREFGAPNLTDGIWLYGGDKASLTTTIRNAHGGVMPRWNARLDPVTIRMLAAYVHSLGGGEANPAPVVADVPAVAAEKPPEAGADVGA